MVEASILLPKEPENEFQGKWLHFSILLPFWKANKLVKQNSTYNLTSCQLSQFLPYFFRQLLKANISMFFLLPDLPPQDLSPHFFCSFHQRWMLFFQETRIMHFATLGSWVGHVGIQRCDDFRFDQLVLGGCRFIYLFVRLQNKD